MKQNTKSSQIWLRWLLPIPIGMMAYVMILLIYDTLDQLGAHFFSQEVLITILLAYITIETQRLFLSFVDKKYPLQLKPFATNSEISQPAPSASLRIVVVPVLSLIFSAVIISLLISIYYSIVLGLTGYSSELIVFNGVYGVVSVLFSIIHVSTSFLAVHKQIHYAQEKELRRGMETDLEKFKLQINPDLLYDGLENLISIVHNDSKAAEQFINHLSRIYRYNLDNRHVELVSLKNELVLSQSLLHVLNKKHHQAVSIQHNLADDWLEHQIVPGTLSTLIQEITRRSIINSYQPVKIAIATNGEGLKLSCNYNPRINIDVNTPWNLSLLNKAYRFFSDRQLELTVNDQCLNINIPLFIIEEE